MSHARPFPTRSETQRRTTDVIDHTNVNDFFNQPSPHEMASTSERRVQEIIEDLKRQTVEEIKNWSCNSSINEEFEAFDFSDHITEETTMIFPRDVVSSPVSLLPASLSSSLTQSNCPAAIPFESKIESLSEPNRSTRFEASSSPPQAKSLRASDRHREAKRTIAKLHGSRDLDNTASNSLTVKRGGKPLPPIPIFAQNFTYQYPRAPLEDPRTPPPPPPVTPATPSAALQQIAQVEEMLRRTFVLKAGQPSMSHEQTVAPSVGEPAIRDPDTSSQSINAIPVAPLRIKRKPLPADSPLLVSLKGHPVYATKASGHDALWM